MTRICIGAALGFAAMCAVQAFVVADFYWLRDVMAWSPTERISLLYATGTCAGAGAAIMWCNK